MNARRPPSNLEVIFYYVSNFLSSIFVIVFLILSIAFMASTSSIDFDHIGKEINEWSKTIELGEEQTTTLELSTKVSMMSNDVGLLKLQIDKILKNQSTSPELEMLTSRLDLMEVELEQMRDALRLEPEKVIETTLLREDIKQLNDRITKLQDDSNRVFGLFQWMIATMVGLLAIAAFNVFYWPKRVITEIINDGSKEISEQKNIDR